MELNSTVQTFSHIPDHSLQPFQMTFTWHRTETTKRHNRVSNVKMAQRDQPLSSTNQHLEMFNAVRSKQGGVIQLRFVVLIQGRMNILWLLTKLFLMHIHKMSHVGLSTVTKCTILITKEITTQVILWFFDILQLSLWNKSGSFNAVNVSST